MSGKADDRRTKKTQKALRDSLTKLMSEKKLNKITVTELAELADINRSTFYLYYTDVFDMLEKTENEMLEEFSEAFEELKKDDPNDYSNLYGFFILMYRYISDNSRICTILLGPDGDSSFVDKFKKLIIHTKTSFNDSVSQTKLKYIRPFIIAGCIGVIQEWLASGMKESPDEMAVISIEIVEDIVRNYI